MYMEREVWEDGKLGDWAACQKVGCFWVVVILRGKMPNCLFHQSSCGCDGAPSCFLDSMRDLGRVI